MQSQFIVLLIGVIVAFVATEGKQLPADIDGKQDYIASDVYNQSKIHMMQDTHQPEYSGDEGPCPNAEDIAPCTCEYFNYNTETMNLDCSAVESEDQLRQIFQSDFPKKDFQYFFLKHNKNLRVLESHVFNDISFQSIYISYNIKLKTIEIDALDSCYETANVIDFYDNDIKFFPFDQLSHFSLLDSLDISENALSEIPAYAFNGLTELEILNLGYSASLLNTPNIVGTFENLPKLKHLHLNTNKLTNITTNFIKTGSIHLHHIDLSGNNIASVEPDAFDIVDGLQISMVANSLTTLDEAVWRPYLEAGVKLMATGNPLLCGCDVAWLFEEDQLLEQVNKKTTCGILGLHHLHNLNTSIFDDC